MKRITYANDELVHIQSPYLAGCALCGKDAFSWHNARPGRKPTCPQCIKEAAARKTVI